ATLYSRVVGVFAALALGLASLGVFAMIAHSVTRRTHEIGIRLALGAEPERILRHVIAEGMALTAAGGVVGIPAGWLLCRVIRSVVYGVPSAPVWIYPVASAVLAAAAATAAVVPAIRAARVDPMLCLRAQ